MTADRRRLFSANFWTASPKHDPCLRLMRREFKIHVAFSPTRLSAEYLRTAYETVTPTIERHVTTEDNDAAQMREHVQGAVPRREGAR